MRILLDTHALLWWLAGSDRLSAVARRAIADESQEVLVSAASAWEIASQLCQVRLRFRPSWSSGARRIECAMNALRRRAPARRSSAPSTGCPAGRNRAGPVLPRRLSTSVADETSAPKDAASRAGDGHRLFLLPVAVASGHSTSNVCGSS